MNNNFNFGTRFVDSDIYRKYANAPFMMEHEIAHKKVIDHFTPEDPAEITQDKNGRWWTHNKHMSSNDIKSVLNDKAYFTNYKKILIAGYVQEIITLGLEDHLDQILETQIKNVKKVVDQLKYYGFQTLFDNCYTNDDGKFFWLCNEAGLNFKQIMKEWMEAGKWCYNFLKAA